MSVQGHIPPDWRAYLTSNKAGYRPLADLMGTQPDLAIFRRFRNVGALDLLYRQSELQIALSRWLDAIRTDQATGRDDMLDCDIEVARLLDSIEGEEVSGEQYILWMDVSEKLAEYCKLEIWTFASVSVVGLTKSKMKGFKNFSKFAPCHQQTNITSNSLKIT